MLAATENPMSPMQRYQSDLARGDLTPDAAQLRAVQRLQDLYERLLQPQEAMGLLGRLMGKRSAKAPECGLYLWGDTGRGKTYLMDTFFDALPFTQKRRVHFQHFMKDIHQALKDLPKTPDPMPLVAAQVAAQIRVLCLDEFQVLDITDAMILAGFLQGLFAQGVTLVTTSNIAPDDLYLNGLQRSRFVPAIGLLKQHTETVFLDSATDYRLQLLEKDGTYHVLGFDQGDELLSAEFAKVTQQTPASGVMTVNGRQIPVRGCHGDVVWFDFAALCDTPRSSLDYIAIAQEYQTLLLGRVPSMRGGRDDAAQRFIQLVDALYDHGVKLVVVAEKAPDELYGEGRLAFPFQRTQSRLFEMRSHEYLGRKHGKQND